MGDFAVKSNWTHKKLQDDLHQHLKKPERMLWCDIPMGPARTIRPDIFSIRKSFVNPRPLVYEVKVSVADFRSDITSGKWQGYMDFACGVTFCAPTGIIKKEDLPKGCGLMVRGDNGWRVLKAPTLETVKPLDEFVYLKLLMKMEDRLRQEIWKDLDYRDRVTRFLRTDERAKEFAQFLRDRERLEEQFKRSWKLRDEEEKQRKELTEGFCQELDVSSLYEAKNMLTALREKRFDSGEVMRTKRAASSAMNALQSLLNSLEFNEKICE